MDKNKINNRISRSRAHEHEARELAGYSDDELRDHLVAYHGWSLGMMRQRGWIEEGSYARSWHAHAHATGHLDPT